MLDTFLKYQHFNEGKWLQGFDEGDPAASLLRGFDEGKRCLGFKVLTKESGITDSRLWQRRLVSRLQGFHIGKQCGASRFWRKRIIMASRLQGRGGFNNLTKASDVMDWTFRRGQVNSQIQGFYKGDEHPGFKVARTGVEMQLQDLMKASDIVASKFERMRAISQLPLTKLAVHPWRALALTL